MTEPGRARILVADDDPTATLLAQAALDQAGFEPVCVADGARALECFEDGGIDLVVLDVEMPGLDGFEACAAIRTSAAGAHTPILMVTGRDDLDSIDRAYEVGATDFVTKPVSWTIFCQRVRYMLRASDALARVREAQKAAEEANDAKRQFLARASHELRTPLHTILGFLELLESALHVASGGVSAGPMDPAETIETIRRSAQHLLRLVDDLLDLSRIEAGKLRVQVARFSVAGLVNDVAVTLRPSAQEQRTELVTHVHPGMDALVSDSTRVRQILTNLAVNAIKCTPAGRVELHARPLEHGGALLEVRDTGMGMTPEQLAHAFEPFMQGENVAAQGRAGLGLAVVRELTQALGGAIDAASTAGRGTVFSVSLPALADAAEDAGESKPTAPAADAAAWLRSSRILVVDDGPDNRRLLDLVLRKAGAQVTLASDGREGLSRALEALRAGEPFDLVLMDLQMPHVDGHQATAELRSAGYASPIVALTANAVQGERERCLSGGFDGHLTKPIDRDTLLRNVAAWVAKQRVR
jgi:signal transduction histidine kinase